MSGALCAASGGGLQAVELPSPKPAASPAVCVPSHGLGLPAPDGRGGKCQWAAAASFPGTDDSLSNASPEAWLVPKCAYICRLSVCGQALGAIP